MYRYNNTAYEGTKLKARARYVFSTANVTKFREITNEDAILRSTKMKLAKFFPDCRRKATRKSIARY